MTSQNRIIHRRPGVIVVRREPKIQHQRAGRLVYRRRGE